MAGDRKSISFVKNTVTIITKYSLCGTSLIWTDYREIGRLNINQNSSGIINNDYYSVYTYMSTNYY